MQVQLQQYGLCVAVCETKTTATVEGNLLFFVFLLSKPVFQTVFIPDLGNSLVIKGNSVLRLKLILGGAGLDQAQ